MNCRENPFFWAVFLAPIIVGILLLAGCGEGGPSDPESKIEQGSYKAIVITYNGRPLRCVERGGSTGLDTTSGAYSGLSCDWVLYHQQR